MYVYPHAREYEKGCDVRSVAPGGKKSKRPSRGMEGGGREIDFSPSGPCTACIVAQHCVADRLARVQEQQQQQQYGKLRGQAKDVCQL